MRQEVKVTFLQGRIAYLATLAFSKQGNASLLAHSTGAARRKVEVVVEEEDVLFSLFEIVSLFLVFPSHTHIHTYIHTYRLDPSDQLFG